MQVHEIEARVKQYQQEGKRLFITSSFQTHSIPLLHIISKIDRAIPVVFINTGFHFPETLTFRDKVADLLGLTLTDTRSFVPRAQQRDRQGRFYFSSDPDHCCFLNKTQPLEPWLHPGSVWINGVRADQNANRRAMQTEQPARNGALRFHPILDWTGKMIYDYIREHKLPKHPLDDQGYMSIGCEPCTRKVTADDPRAARWFGLNKTECGLHTDLITK
jgi:phosphoadenosine phosphosulfate reductase